MRQPGFTLLELLITIAVGAILLAIAVPSFLSSIHSQQVASVAENFEQDIAWVRGQAISGASSATLTLATDCSWVASTGSAADTQHSMSTAQLAKDSPGLTCNVPTGGLALSFTNLGLVKTTNASTSTITFVSGTSLPVSVEVFGSGAIVEDPQHAS
ncbi:MAG: GspH/FimT family pseudopilin [Acidobacteriaceae bacterium]